MAVEICLLQMPTLIAGDSSVEFNPSPFFTEQLTAFEAGAYTRPLPSST